MQKIVINVQTGEQTTVEITDAAEIASLTSAESSIELKFEYARLALQSAIDNKAQSFGFSGGNALMLYVGFANPFQPLAQQFALWEVSVWLEAAAYKTEILAGTKPMLTPEEAVALMPAY